MKSDTFRILFSLRTYRQKNVRGVTTQAHVLYRRLNGRRGLWLSRFFPFLQLSTEQKRNKTNVIHPRGAPHSKQASSWDVAFEDTAISHRHDFFFFRLMREAHLFMHNVHLK